MNTIASHKNFLLFLGVVSILFIPFFLFAQVTATDAVLVPADDASTEEIPGEEVRLGDDINAAGTPVNPPVVNTAPTRIVAPTPTTNRNQEIYQTNIPEGGVNDVANALDQLNRSAATVDSQIGVQIRTGIDSSLTNIRNTNPTISPSQLNTSIFQQETDLFREVNETLFRQEATNAERIDTLNDRVGTSLGEIEGILEENSGVAVDLGPQRRNIAELLRVFKEEVAEKRDLINNRGGDLLFKDGDGDGLSDYDETYIYGTDPNNAFTVAGELTDSEKVLNGINPLSETGSVIEYEDPKNSDVVFISDLYQITEIKLIKNADATIDEPAGIKLQGKGLPNSFITLYIFSTPVVVTVKTDAAGEWEYTLDEELENGDHEVFVTTVNNSGKIIARSNSIPFTKSAEAATIGLLGETPGAGGPPLQPNVFKDNFLLLILAILVAGIVITLMLVGRNTKIHEVVKDLHDEVKD